MSSPRGEVYDIGFQRYTGPREGRARARKAIWANGVRTALGIGRGWTSKVLPAILFLALMGPALVFIILASTLGGILEDIPGHAEYYEGASIILMAFSAIIAPELLTADKRSGVINLYLVRPISPTDYVLGRWLAFFTITLGVLYLPQVVLLVGLTLGADHPLEYLRGNWLEVPRFLGAGLVLALFMTTLPLAAAAFTTRRAYAAAFVIALWLVSSAVSHALVAEMSGEWRNWFALIDIGGVPIFISDMVFGKTLDIFSTQNARELPRAVVVLWYVFLTAGPGLLLWWRYRKLAI